MEKARIIKAAVVAVVILAMSADFAVFASAKAFGNQRADRSRIEIRSMDSNIRNGSEPQADQSREEENGVEGGGVKSESYRDQAGEETNDDDFMISVLPGHIADKMNGGSYPEDAAIGLEELRYVQVLHIGFDGRAHRGELVVNQLVAEEILEIFMELYEKKYPIEQIRLIDDYGADDEASMADNNTSGFCWREVAGGGSMSVHAQGLAIDINPLLNPYVKVNRDGSTTVLPPEGKKYLERNGRTPGMIMKGDACHEAFTSRGWEWGGDWTTLKDYQHFYKTSQ